MNDIVANRGDSVVWMTIRSVDMVTVGIPTSVMLYELTGHHMERRENQW